MARRVADSLLKVTDDLMSASTGTSVAAARRVAAGVDRARESVLKRCDRPSADLYHYFRVADARTTNALSNGELRIVMDAYTSWARAVGEGPAADDLRRRQEWCRDLKRQVKASYRVWWRWAETGRAWWIEMRFHNGLPQALGGSLYGKVRVTGLAGQDRRWFARGQSRTGVIGWGASSGDSVVIRPGESRSPVLLGDDPYVSTTSDGVVSVQEIGLSVDKPRGWSAWCSLPVPERW